MLTELQQHNQITESIPEQDWLEKKAKHESRVDELLSSYLRDRSHHKKNPVMDFLFEYYAFRPSNLRKWSPGIGATLYFSDFDQLPEISELTTSDSVAFIDPVLFPEKRISSLKWMLMMLENTQSSKPAFGCFGMHEWAMVYKTEHPRHKQVPMRMEPDELAEFVESRPLLCTHFDAFRFFTKPAKPMNRFELSRETFHENEQPGCIHSNMDLYKWAFKMYPWIPSSLILEAFELAVEARYIDMQASPYDLRDQGLEPIKIETEDGRKEYKEKQEMIFRKGIPIREKIIQSMQKLLDGVIE
ncbi:MAG: 3-methyladenine DNA glycosylase [Balneolaceae bacterium]